MSGPARRATLLAGLMAVASIAGYALRPQSRVAQEQAPELGAMIPPSFAAWSTLAQAAAQIVNPQTQAILSRLYAQVLMRTYVHEDGYRVMLSVTYGVEQRGEFQAHLPEVCYPAQGFEIEDNQAHSLRTPFGELSARRLKTRKSTRREPVTYWYVVAGEVVQSQIESRLIEIRLGLQGRVPDGLLFRVSSIDADAGRAYRRHEEFIGDLLSALTADDRRRLSGLAP